MILMLVLMLATRHSFSHRDPSSRLTKSVLAIVPKVARFLGEFDSWKTTETIELSLNKKLFGVSDCKIKFRRAQRERRVEIPFDFFDSRMTIHLGHNSRFRVPLSRYLSATKSRFVTIVSA